MNTLEEGEKLIRQGQWVLERDLQTALEEGNFHLAVRRAQEVVDSRRSHADSIGIEASGVEELPGGGSASPGPT
jgi:hypothetical protein